MKLLNNTISGIIYDPVTKTDKVLSYDVVSEKTNGIRVWTFEPPNITEDAEFEIIQPKQLK
jgi:hypothetical protein